MRDATVVSAEEVEASAVRGEIARAVGRGLRGRIDEIVERVVALWRADVGDLDADGNPGLEASIRRAASLGTGAVAAVLSDGEVPAAANPAIRGSLAAKGALTLSLVAKLHLGWRQACIEAVREEAGRLGATRAALEQCLGVVEAAFELSVVRMARRFEVGRKGIDTETATRREQLQHQALHDPLTGLANRALLLDRLDRAIRAMGRRAGAPAVLFLDLDGFKGVNDSVGHAAGDRVLLAIAERLRDAVRPDDTVARLGGDEFVVLCEGLSEPRREAAGVAAGILGVFAQPITLGGRDVVVGVSVGVAVGGEGDHALLLLEQADQAMYHAKQRGSGRFEVYDPSIDRQARRRAEVSATLGGAAGAGQFALAYQPVIDLATRRPLAREALLRWRHPHLGTVPPAEFVPMAVQSGLIDDIGRWVVQRACEDCARWRALAAPDLGVTVNVSGRELGRAGFARGIAAALDANGLAPQALTLEIPEADLVHARSEALAVLAEVRETGVRIGLDDFGSGQSSLSWLARLPLDQVKVGRGVVATLGDSERSLALVEAMADAGHALGLDLVAQGVETEAQLDRLTASGFDAAQGFLLGLPVVPEAGADAPPGDPTAPRAG